MSLTFTQSLDTSRALQERLASTPTNEKRAALEEKATLTDFATFGMFKEAWAESIGPALSAAARSPLGKGLQWGAGIGIPTVGAAHLMARGARHEGEKLVDHTRNQALLTALGVGGIRGAGEGLRAALRRPETPRAPAALPNPTPRPVEEPQSYEREMARPGLGVEELSALRGYPGLEELGDFEGYKTSSDAALQKLAAVVLLDDVLEQQISKLAGAEQADAIECLFLNRSHGTRLLRELY